jgi:hypothetical protein
MIQPVRSGLVRAAACGAVTLFAAGIAAAAEPAPGADAMRALEPRVETSPAPAAMAPRAAATPAAAAPAVAPPATAREPAARPAARAQDRLDLDATQITGNRELPRVMYVVPWKRPEVGVVPGRPANSLLDEVLAPVDRDVFLRQGRYYEALRPDTPVAQ